MENVYIAIWKITEMDNWHDDYLTLLTPAEIQFDLSGSGRLQFGTYKAQLKWEILLEDDMIEFVFKGYDNDVSGGLIADGNR